MIGRYTQHERVDLSSLITSIKKRYAAILNLVSMVNPTERRSTSELDISSMRRISDALLLAQNRARRATDRANHAEHIMRLVLTRLGVPRLHINSLADEETVRAAVSSTSFSSMISPQQRSSIIDVIEPEDTVSVTSSTICIEEIAKDVVTNLHIAMIHHRRYVNQFTFPTLHVWLWGPKLSELCHSVQMMAGFLAGVLVGVVVTKHWQMHVMRPQSETPSLFSKLACWCSGRVPVPGTPWHLIPLPMDGYHYLMNEILEVV